MNSINLVYKSLIETLYMVFVSSFFACFFGLILGVVLVITRKDHIKPNPIINSILSRLVDIFRAVPFIILMIYIIPFTRLVVGKAIGLNAVIVPLVVSAIPFFARQVESSLLEISPGIIEAATSLGLNIYEMITKVLIFESIPSLIRGVATTVISLIAYSAMAGAIGGGGLGDLAIRYGYHRFRPDIMTMTVVVLIVLVNLIQFIATRLSNKLERRGN